jgi:hypothetical protein
MTILYINNFQTRLVAQRSFVLDHNQQLYNFPPLFLLCPLTNPRNFPLPS